MAELKETIGLYLKAGFLTIFFIGLVLILNLGDIHKATFVLGGIILYNVIANGIKNNRRLM